jgi:type IV pilus assembly protein PilP
MSVKPSQNFVNPVNYSVAQMPHRSTIILICLCLLTACSNDMSDLEQYVTETRTKYQGSVEPLPQFEPYQNYVYSTFNYRTPFTEPSAAQPDDQASDTGPRPDKDRRKEPLEFFPLDSLQMVGTLERGGESWGLVRDPDGTIHRVQPGNHAGENFGEIIRISETSIDLLEIIPDGLGAWIEREISLSLGEE